MINREELRPFITVQWKGNISTVVGFEHDYPDSRVKLSDIFGGTIWVTEKDIEGIPLTPEWLERCGFESSELDEDYYYFMRLKSELGIQHFRSYYDCKEVVLLDGDHTTVGRPCIYVHQLQNLYFALTGEELAIKELATP